MRSMTSTGVGPIVARRSTTWSRAAGGSRASKWRAFFRGQIADDQGDGLRLFLLEQIEQLAGVHFQERLHGGHRRRRRGDAAG